MQKRSSKSKINGKIIMMQNDLMSKLAIIEEPITHLNDELGFPSINSQQFDSLTNLLSKAKTVIGGAYNQSKIQGAKKSSQNLRSNQNIQNVQTTKKRQSFNLKC